MKNKNFDLGKTLRNLKPEDVEQATGAYYQGYFNFIKKLIKQNRKLLIVLGGIILLILLTPMIITLILGFLVFLFG